MAKNLTRSWQSQINDKLTGPMVLNKLKRNLWINKLMEEKDWVGTGELDGGGSAVRNSKIISFLGSETSSVKIGAFQDPASIQITDPIRGFVESYVDMTGSMKVRQKDIKQHRGKGLVTSLLGKFDKQTDYAMNGFKQQIEDGILSGSVISKVTSIADVASGLLTLAHPEKIGIGMNVQLAGTDATTKGTEVFAISVNKNTGKVGFSLTLGGSAANLTNYVASTAALTTICVDGSVNTSGAVAYGFDSLDSILLSSTNGGDASYLGQTKTAYPFLQAYNKDGSDMTSSDFLPLLFQYNSSDISLKTRHPEGTKPKDYFLSPLNCAIAMNNSEIYKGAFYRNDKAEANPYGWTSIVLGSQYSGGDIRLNRVENLSDSTIPVLNMDTFSICSDGGIEFIDDPNNPGNSKYWYVSRATTAAAYTHILDYILSAQFVCGNPESNAIIHSVSMSFNS